LEGDRIGKGTAESALAKCSAVRGYVKNNRKAASTRGLDTTQPIDSQAVLHVTHWISSAPLNLYPPCTHFES